MAIHYGHKITVVTDMTYAELLEYLDERICIKQVVYPGLHDAGTAILFLEDTKQDG